MGSHLCLGAWGAVGGSVPCSRAPRRGIEDGERAVQSLPPPTIPASPGLELATFGLWVRLSPIRPRLPLKERRGQQRSLAFNYISLLKAELILTGLKVFFALILRHFNQRLLIKTLNNHINKKGHPMSPLKTFLVIINVEYSYTKLQLIFKWTSWHIFFGIL